MKQGEQFINNVYTKYLIYEEKDRPIFRSIYKNWKEINESLNKIMGSNIELPKSLTEGIFALETGHVRIISPQQTFDCYDFIHNKRISIITRVNLLEKVLLKHNIIHNDLYLFDFYRNGDFDEVYDLYLIPNEILNSVLNEEKSKKINIYNDIINLYRIQPLTTMRI